MLNTNLELFLSLINFCSGHVIVLEMIDSLYLLVKINFRPSKSNQIIAEQIASLQTRLKFKWNLSGSKLF